jgi:hypothetical protein
MTIRERMATAMMARRVGPECSAEDRLYTARLAVRDADALLAALEEPRHG